MQYYTFRTIIEPDENNTFHGWVPLLKGCHTCGDTIEETKKNLQEAIEVYIESLAEDGLPIPRENGLEYVATVPLSRTKVNQEKAYA